MSPEVLTPQMVVACAVAAAIVIFVVFRSGRLELSSKALNLVLRITVGDKEKPKVKTRMTQKRLGDKRPVPGHLPE